MPLGRLATEAGLPAGRPERRHRRRTHRRAGHRPAPGRRRLAFTGSTAVGRHSCATPADSNLKRVWLELGGKSPNIILPDAPDLEKAAATAAWGIFFNQGEMCTAPSRLLVHSSVAERVTDAIVARARELRIGDPLDPATEMGALVGERHLERVLDHIGTGLDEGARLRAGGPHPDRHRRQLPAAHRLRPRGSGMRLAREEIFGPVLSVLTFDDLDEAVALANDTEYGLAAGLWTSDLSTAHQVSRALKAGTVWVNCYEEGDLTVPFGGMKQSGNGRDKSAHALEKYTELKTTWIKL